MIMFMTASIDRKTHVKPQNTDLCRLTVCVTGAGADVDSVWVQKKLEARKMLENAAESPASSARFVSPLCIFT
jgi:hypothetical protein